MPIIPGVESDRPRVREKLWADMSQEEICPIDIAYRKDGQNAVGYPSPPAAN
jgi:hypothetical protein